MAASENLKKAVLYAKSQCGLKPCFQVMQDEELVYYLDHLADTDGEGDLPKPDEGRSEGQQEFDL